MNQLLESVTDYLFNGIDEKDVGILTAIEDKRSKWDCYFYNKKPVPRVSEILSACIGREYLTNWAASLGDNFKTEKFRILDTGTYAHNMIEDFLSYGYVREDTKLALGLNPYTEQSTNCYYNFVRWWNSMIEQGVKIKIEELEKPLVCPLYGGTADIVADIMDADGYPRKYILDFKTSKAISIDYLYQTMMYLEAYNFNTPDPEQHATGIGVIRCDKFDNKFEFIHIDAYKDQRFFDSIRRAVYDMIDWYYYNIDAQYNFKQFKKSYFKYYSENENGTN